MPALCGGRSGCADDAGEADAIHPPKHETFDLVARTNTDPKGIVRAVDEYACTRGGSTSPGPPRAGPSSITSNRGCCRRWACAPPCFTSIPGHERDHDYYLDVGEYTPGPDVWRSEDHYLDIEVRTGRERIWPMSTSCWTPSGTAC